MPCMNSLMAIPMPPPDNALRSPRSTTSKQFPRLWSTRKPKARTKIWSDKHNDEHHDAQGDNRTEANKLEESHDHNVDVPRLRTFSSFRLDCDRHRRQWPCGDATAYGISISCDGRGHFRA